MEKGVPIRSVSRSLTVLQAINRAGSLSMMDIAHASRVPYPTACRIVQTLVCEGMIEREPVRKHYRPTALVQTLSHGFQDHSRLTNAAHPLLVDLTRRIKWPVLTNTRVGRAMMVRDSTQSLTPMSFTAYHPGYLLPMLESASGRCYLAFADPEERESVLDALARSEEDYDKGLLEAMRSGKAVETIRDEGFATSVRNTFTAVPGKTSSISVPILEGGRPHATLTMVFFASALDIQSAVESFVPMLKATAARIVEALAASPSAPA